MSCLMEVYIPKIYWNFTSGRVLTLELIDGIKISQVEELRESGSGQTFGPYEFNYIARFALEQNVPNPFNPTTTIRFTLEKAVHVTISIHDVKGRRITTLIDDVRSAGPHEVLWVGANASGASVSSGVYFYRMRAVNNSLSILSYQKM